MGRPRYKITEQDIEFYKRWNHVVKNIHFARLFDCSERAITKMASSEGITKPVGSPRNKRFITFQQLEIIYANNLDHIPEIKITDQYPDSSEDSWHDVNLSCLENSYGRLATVKTAKKIGKSVSSIHRAANKNDISFFEAFDDCSLDIVLKKYGNIRARIARFVESGKLKIREVGKFKFVNLDALDKALVEEGLKDKDGNELNRPPHSKPAMLRCQECGIKALKDTLYCKDDKCLNRQNIRQKELKFRNVSSK